MTKQRRNASIDLVEFLCEHLTVQLDAMVRATAETISKHDAAGTSTQLKWEHRLYLAVEKAARLKAQVLSRHETEPSP